MLTCQTEPAAVGIAVAGGGVPEPDPSGPAEGAHAARSATVATSATSVPGRARTITTPTPDFTVGGSRQHPSEAMVPGRGVQARA